VAGVGVVVAAVVLAVGAADPTALHPSLQPLAWPALPLVPAAAVLLGALPAWLAPPLAVAGPAAHPTVSSTVRQAEAVS
jgi:hypothetical protein